MAEYKYVTKQEILEWVNIQRPLLNDVEDHIMLKGHAKVDATLIRMRYFTLPNTNDSRNFLKMAASCFILALLCKARIIAQTSGELLTDRFKDVTYQFQRTNPLFFFATGTSDPFQQLMPYETFRVMAYEFVRSYIRWQFYITKGQIQPKPKIVHDHTSRGAYWNIDSSEHDADDALYGETLDEDDSDVERRNAPRWV